MLYGGDPVGRNALFGDFTYATSSLECGRWPRLASPSSGPSRFLQFLEVSMIRTVSMLPAATEIVGALGMMDQLLAVSHECDFPSGVERLPVCTEPKFNPAGTSREIDQRVKTIVSEALSVYRVHADVLCRGQAPR